jgi:tetratricopeptide (TPR) repeat protein
VKAQPKPEPQPPPQPAGPNPDELYNAAMAKLVEGDWKEARKVLHQILDRDAHYARAHFRMGEIAMLNRNFEPALGQYQQALDDIDRLDEREKLLTRLGMAISMHNRDLSQRIAAQINTRYPNDPDLRRIVPAFPGMFLGGQQNERPRRFKPH